MKKTLIMGAAALFLLTHAACDDSKAPNITVNGDNNTALVNPLNTLAALPTAVDGMTTTYDAQGRLVLLSGLYTKDGCTMTFSYPAGNTLSVGITDNDNGRDRDSAEVEVLVDEFGRAVLARCQEYEGSRRSDYYEWTFSYDADGYLTQARRYVDDPETYTLSYRDGDLVSVVCKDGNERETTSLSAVSAEYPSGITNTAGVELFSLWNVDLDELQYLWYAGLLGKAPRLLTLSATERRETHTALYEMNADGFVTTARIYENGRQDDILTWQWD